jgi:hypothetical protein
VPLWASWLWDFDILNIIYDELKIEKVAKFEILIATNGLITFVNKYQVNTAFI